MSMVERYDAHIAAAEEAGNVLGAQLLKGQRDIFNAARAAGVVTELPMAVALTSESKRRPAKTPEKRLQDAVEAYKSEPITPKSVNGLWVAQGEVWESGLLAAGERVSLTIPRFSGSKEELTQAVDKGNMVIVVPDELSTQYNCNRRGSIYHIMGRFWVQGGY